MYSFGQGSRARIAEVHVLLQELANKTIKKTNFDFGIPSTGGLRTAEVQKELYDKGYSKCDGTILKSFHQTGKALDFVPYINGTYTWGNKKAFLAIAKTTFQIWKEIPDKQGFYLHWGGFWSARDLNGNGLLEPADKLGWDAPHYELRHSEQTRGKMPIDWA